MQFLFGEFPQPVKGIEENTSQKKTQGTECFQGHGRLGDLKGGRSCNDGVKGTDHKSQDEVNHGGPMHFQRIFHNADDAHNSCKDAAAKNDEDGKVGKIHMKEFTNGSDDGNV